MQGRTRVAGGVVLATLVLLAGACSEREPRTSIRELLTGIDETRMTYHIRMLTQEGPRSPDNPAAIRHTVSYIEAQLQQYGYEPRRETVEYDETDRPERVPVINIIAEHPGTADVPRVLELAAHYDTVPGSPGADDNASGVAAVLEIARIVAPLHTGAGIRFCFFAREEDGRDGSRYHVRQMRNRDERLEGAFVLEMIGYATDAPDSQDTPLRIPLLFSPPTTGNFITVVGDLRSGGLGARFEEEARLYVPALPYYSVNRLGGFFRDALRSDHKAYWDNGYRAIMLTDTANFRNPNYHETTDTVDTLNFTFLTAVTRATAATLLELAGTTGP